MDTFDNVASSIINVMVPGPREIRIEEGDNIMILKKDFTAGSAGGNVLLPPFRGSTGGINIKLRLPKPNATSTTLTNTYGLQASNAAFNLV